MTLSSLSLLVAVFGMIAAVGSAEPVRELKFSAPPLRPIPRAVGPLTPEKKLQLEAFAKKTVELLRDRDNYALRQLADVESHANAIYDGLGFPPALEAGLKNDVRQQFRAPSAGLFDGTVKSNPSYIAFVRLGEEQGVTYARFLEAYGWCIFDYFDLFPVATSEGTFLWVDIRTSASWERVIEGMRRTHFARAAIRGDLGRKAAAGVTAADKLFLDFGEKMPPLSEDTVIEVRKEIVRYLDEHRSVVDRNRRLSLMRIDAMSSASSPKEYAAAMDQFVERFPDDRTVPSLIFWSRFVSGRWDEAFAAIEGLESAYGPDPYLDTLRASVRGEQKRFQESAEFAKKGLASYPDAPFFHILLMEASSALEDYAVVEREIKLLMETFRMNPSASILKENPRLKDFTASEAGRNFLRTLPP